MKVNLRCLNVFQACLPSTYLKDKENQRRIPVSTNVSYSGASFRSTDRVSASPISVLTETLSGEACNNLIKDLPADCIQEISKMLLKDSPSSLFSLELAYPRIRKSIDKKTEYLAGVSLNPFSIINLPEEFKNNKDIALQAVKKNWRVLQYLNTSLKNDEDIAMQAVLQNPMVIKELSEELRDCNKIGTAAVSLNGNTLKYLSERLKDDFDICLTAIRQCGLAFQYCSEDLRDNDLLFYAAMSRNSSVHVFSSERLKEAVQLWLAM